MWVWLDVACVGVACTHVHYILAKQRLLIFTILLHTVTKQIHFSVRSVQPYSDFVSIPVQNNFY